MNHLFRSIRRAATAVSVVTAAVLALPANAQGVAPKPAPPGQAGVPFPAAPDIAPIGVRLDKFLDVPEAAKGPAVDPKKGYRIEELGRGLYMVTDNAYQSMFMVYESGVVVVDAPPSYAAKLKQAIGEVTSLPITHLVYSHAHTDHIGGAGALGGNPVIVAHEETRRLLRRDGDSARPLPTVVFSDTYELRVGTQRLELSYHGDGHEPGNIFIYAPEQKTLMVVDVVFPGWMPFRRFAVAHDLPAWLAQAEKIATLPFDKFVGGHVARVGTRADVLTQIEFDNDVRNAAATALKSVPFMEGINPADSGNPWALTSDYTARVAGHCVKALTPKWKNRLGGFDAFIWDQCYAMEQSLRVD
jgi:glyoxylase-like metal-dependent hydrolase (beta-lactamase superfamily II)